MTEQLALTNLWPCPTCDATGHIVDNDTGKTRRCPVCLGSGSLPFDADDTTEMGF